VQASEAAVAASPTEGRAWLALAESRAAQGRASFAAGKKGPGDGWIAACDAYEKAAAASPPGEEARLLGIRRLLEGAGTAATQGNVVVTRALALASSALKEPTVPSSTRTTYVRTIHDAAAVLTAQDRKGAREAIKAGHELLRPVYDGAKTEEEPATVWNALVTFDRANKFGIGEKYVTVPTPFFSGNYTLEIPVGPRWKALGGSSGCYEDDWGERREPNRILRVDAKGNREGWFWGQLFGFGWVYRFADAVNPVGGDNPAAIADIAVTRFSSHYFKSVTSKKVPKRGKVNVHLTGFAYELCGVGNNDLPMRIRGWVFRGRAQQSFGLVFLDELPSDAPDPEFDAIIASMREYEP
jgi:hypothetical protein